MTKLLEYIASNYSNTMAQEKCSVQLVLSIKRTVWQTTEV